MLDRFPLKKEVESANSRRLDQLPGQSIKYVSVDKPGFNIEGKPINERLAARLLDNLLATKVLTLKVTFQD